MEKKDQILQFPGLTRTKEKLGLRSMTLSNIHQTLVIINDRLIYPLYAYCNLNYIPEEAGYL